MWALQRPGLRLTLRFASLSLILLFLAVAGAGAAEVGFVPQNCALTLPQGWGLNTNLPKIPFLVACYANPDQTAIVMLMVNTRDKPSGPINEKFIRDFNTGVEESGGGKFISGKLIKMGGLPAYERAGLMTIKGQQIINLIRVVQVKGQSYSIQGMRFDGGDVTKDPQVLQVFDSFRFLHPPVPPPSAEYSASYRFGTFVGRALVVLAIIGGVAAIIFTVIRVRRRRLPPPLPM